MSIGKFIQAVSTIGIADDAGVFVVDDDQQREGNVVATAVSRVFCDAGDREGCLIFNLDALEAALSWHELLDGLKAIDADFSLVAGFEISAKPGYVRFDFPIVACTYDRSQNRVLVAAKGLKDLAKMLESLWEQMSNEEE